MSEFKHVWNLDLFNKHNICDMPEYELNYSSQQQIGVFLDILLEEQLKNKDMQIKAKFKCNSIVDIDYGQGYNNRTVEFSAIYGKEGENATFSKATPTGKLSIQIDKETAAYDYFKPGKNYYLLIEEVNE